MVRLLAFIEALGVTGPLRNLLQFAPHVDLEIATYRRRSLGERHDAGIAAMSAAARDAGVPVHVIDERHAFDPRVTAEVHALTSRLAPDIVQTHNIKSHALVACTRAAARTPWVAFHHGYTDTDAKVRVYNRLDRWSLRRADLVITTCRPFARTLARHGVHPSRIEVVHNAAPRAASLSREEARGALDVSGRTVVLGAGRLSREKGFDVLIDALARMDAVTRGRLLLLVAGDGPERERLRRRAASLDVPVRFDGHATDMSRYYAAADVFVLPSRSEGSPNVLIEAMAAGCPIVATQVGGVPELVDDCSALIVRPDAPEALRAAISRVIDERAMASRLGESARHAAAALTPHRRAARLLDIYNSLASPCASAVLAR